MHAAMSALQYVSMMLADRDVNEAAAKAQVTRCAAWLCRGQQIHMCALLYQFAMPALLCWKPTHKMVITAIRLADREVSGAPEIRRTPSNPEQLVTHTHMYAFTISPSCLHCFFALYRGGPTTAFLAGLCGESACQGVLYVTQGRVTLSAHLCVFCYCA